MGSRRSFERVHVSGESRSLSRDLEFRLGYRAGTVSGDHKLAPSSSKMGAIASSGGIAAQGQWAVEAYPASSVGLGVESGHLSVCAMQRII